MQLEPSKYYIYRSFYYSERSNETQFVGPFDSREIAMAYNRTYKGKPNTMYDYCYDSKVYCTRDAQKVISSKNIDFFMGANEDAICEIVYKLEQKNAAKKLKGSFNNV